MSEAVELCKKIVKAFRFLDALIKISRFVPDLFLSDMIFKKDIGSITSFC